MGDKDSKKKTDDKSEKIDKYLKVAKMHSLKTEADPKFQKDMPDVMDKAASAAVARAKGITSDEPKDKTAKGYIISGTLTKLTKETKGKQDIYACVVNMVLAEWPTEKVLVQKLEGKTKVAAQTGGTEKQAKKDAEACVSDATKGAIETAIDYILSQ